MHSLLLNSFDSFIKKSIFMNIFILLINIEFSTSTICSYYDTYTKTTQSVYCSQTCCIGAYSIDDACCYEVSGWVWWIALLSIGFPVLITIAVIVLLCFIIHRRKRVAYPGRVINVETVNAPPVYSINSNNYALPPYNVTNETALDSVSQNEPPSYNSIVKYSTDSEQPIVHIKTSDDQTTNENKTT